MVREYQEQTVYEALMDRFKLLFEEFENIYISFSGGKDSGLLLNLILDYRNKYYPEKPIGVFHQDFEAQYTVTTEYIERTFEKIKDQVEPYWVCLPMATRTALSSYEMFWYPWDDKKQELWVREMPKHEYVINLENNPKIYCIEDLLFSILSGKVVPYLERPEILKEKRVYLTIKK